MLGQQRPGTVVSNREDRDDRLSSTHGNEGSTSSEAGHEVGDDVDRLIAGLASNSIVSFFLFCVNSLICLEGKSMTPHRGEHYSLPFLPATPSTRLVRCFRNYIDTRTPSGVAR